MPDQLEQLQSRFSIPGCIAFESGEGGLTRAVLNAAGGAARLYLHGAHVAHFQPAGQKPLLFMSAASHFEAGKPIRGGVPICFPWFGPHPSNSSAPAHGFARLKSWSVDSTTKTEGGAVQIVLSLRSQAEDKQWWPHDFHAKYTVTVAEQLRLALEIHNTDSQPMQFAEALHTYFHVGDIRKVSIGGLENTTYIDKVQAGKRVLQPPQAIAFTGETDRVYLDTRGACTAHDPAGGREISVAKENSDTTVIWNPWIAKAKAMADFGDEEWTGMLCIETCNVADYCVTLPSGRSHRMTAIIRSQNRR